MRYPFGLPVRFAALAGVLLAASASGQAPAPKDKAPTGVEALKLPPGAVIVVGKSPQDALQKPDGFLLSPEQYQKLLDQIDQLKKQAAPAPIEAPTTCRLSGKIEARGGQEVVRLQAVFEFRIKDPRTTVTLACSRAKPVAATLSNGQLPLLKAGDDGLSVTVGSIGDYKLTLELELPLSARGTKSNERGFDLDLPGAAITTIEKFEVPPGVAKVRVGGRVLPTQTLAVPSGGLPAVVLGAVTRLEAGWEVPTPIPQAAPLTSVEGRIHVTVDDVAVTTVAKLTLKVLRGVTADWQLLLPSSAELTVEGPAAGILPRPMVPEAGFEPAPTVVRPSDPKKPIWVVRRKEPSAEDLRVEVTVRQPRQGKGPYTVGPFSVVGAFRQSGTVTVAASANVRLRYRPAPDLRRRDTAGEDPSTDAAFHYAALSTTRPLLEFDAEPLQGVVQTQGTSRLTVVDGGWLLTADYRVTPVRAEVEAVEFDLPADLRDVQATPAELVEAVVPGREENGRRRMTVRLAGPRKAAFGLSLSLLYPVPRAAEAATLVLPRPVGTLDREATLQVVVPDGLEVRATAREWDGDRPGDMAIPLDPAAEPGMGKQPPLTFAGRRPPAQVDLAWKPYRPDLPVETTADLTLYEKQAHLRFHWRFTTPQPGPLVLRWTRPKGGPMPTPESATGVRMTPEGDWMLPADAKRGPVATVGCLLPLPDRSLIGEPTPLRLEVPVLWPVAATRGEVRLRVWNGPGVAWLAREVGAGWDELPTEVVPGRDSLPALVLLGNGPTPPPHLELSEPAGPPPIKAVIERVLVQVYLAEGGGDAYRARFLLRKLAGRSFAFDLPVPPTLVTPEVFLDGKKVIPRPVSAEAGGDATGRTVAVELAPEQARQPTVLEVRYSLGAAERASLGVRSAMTDVRLLPPRPNGPALVGVVRWEATLPGGWVPLYLGDKATFEQGWRLSQMLPVPVAAHTSADLERWFSAGSGEPDASEATDTSTPTLVARTASMEPLRLFAVARTPWMIACSGVVLVFGIGLTVMRRSHRGFWLAATLSGLALVAAVFWLPQASAQAAAAAVPGLAVLFGVLGVYSLLQQRYRRRLVFMPGFTRVAAGSSLVRVGSSRKNREQPPASGLETKPPAPG